MNLEKEQTRAKEHSETLSEKEEKITKKLESFQELYDSNQKMIYIGRKVHELLNKYFQTNNKKQFLNDFMKWVTIEKSKYQKKIAPKSKAQKERAKAIEKKQQEKLEEVKKEVLHQVKKVRRRKQAASKKIEQEKANYTYQLNDRVRLIDSNAVGTIEKIEKKSVEINYGLFTTKTSIDKLELVEAAKK